VDRRNRLTSRSRTNEPAAAASLDRNRLDSPPLWLAGRMSHTRIRFADQVGMLLHEVDLNAIPRVGDSVNLKMQQAFGVVDLVTWEVGDQNFDTRVVVRLKPHPA
jgi:hypothetical protein